MARTYTHTTYAYVYMYIMHMYSYSNNKTLCSKAVSQKMEKSEGSNSKLTAS